MIVIVSVAVATLAALFVLLITGYVRKKNEMDIFRRMRRHQISEPATAPAKSKKTFRQTFYELIQKISTPFEAFDDTIIFSKLDFKLKQAGINFTAPEFVVMNLLAAGVVEVLVYMLTINGSLAISIALLIPLGIWLTVLISIRRRKNSFTEQLGDCLTTIANALRAGYSFQQAAEVIAKEMEPPISEEFARLSADIRMGIPLEAALNETDKRVENSDFTLVVTAVLIQREVGGNLAQILDTISDTIMERIRMKREINALTAQGKFSAMILLFLPFVIGIFMFMINPEQMGLLFSETPGRIAVALAIVMDLIGFLIIRRIVNIEI